MHYLIVRNNPGFDLMQPTTDYYSTLCCRSRFLAPFEKKVMMKLMYYRTIRNDSGAE